jgi:hypothetical protein
MLFKEKNGIHFLVLWNPFFGFMKSIYDFKKMDLWNSPLKRLRLLLLLLLRTTTGPAMTQRARKMVGPLFWPPTVSTEATLLSFVFCHTAYAVHRVLVNLAIWVHKKPWGFSLSG